MMKWRCIVGGVALLIGAMLWTAGCTSSRSTRSRRALIATMTVDSDMRMAPTSGESRKPVP